MTEKITNLPNTTKFKPSLIPLKKLLKHSTEKLKNKWCIQLLYKTKIIHDEMEDTKYNICLDNLKVDSKNNLIITNESKNSDVDTEVQTDVRYKAPELINSNETSKAGGVWATGICVYYIKNLSFPWKAAVKSDENYCLWANKGIFPSTSNDSYLRISKLMLCVDPKNRPSIKDVIIATINSDVDPNILRKSLINC